MHAAPVEYEHSVDRIAPLPADVVKQHVKYECTCKDFRTDFNCWHVLCFGLFAGSVQVPRGYSIVDIGPQPARGPPKKMSGALSRT